MKKEFSNPKMDIKRFNRESVLTASGDVKTTNAQHVSDELDKRAANRDATTIFNLSWD